MTFVSANVLAINVTENSTFHPINTFAYYNASWNMTDIDGITVGTDTVTFSETGGSVIISHDPAATTYYQLKDINISFNDTSTDTWAENVTFTITEASGETVGSFTNAGNHTVAVLDDAEYTITYTHPDFDDSYEEFTVNASTIRNYTIQLYPSAIWLLFTEAVNGTVATIECLETHDCYMFENMTEIYIPDDNMTIGYVYVMFNNDSAGDWQQTIQYYNDGDLYVKEYVLVEDIDIVQQFKATDDGAAIENARICTSKLGVNPNSSNIEYLTTYCDYTNSDGDAFLYLDQQSMYKVCGSKTGYTTRCSLEEIAPNNDDIIQFELEPTSNEAGYNYIATTCGTRVESESNCTLYVATYKPYSSICLRIYTNGTQTGYSCGYSSVSREFLYTLNSSNANYTLQIELATALEHTIYHTMVPFTYTNEIDWNYDDYTGQDMKDKLESDTEYLIAFYIFMIVFGVISGYLLEKYMKGTGPYGTAFFFAIIGTAGFYIFWIPASIIIIYGIFKILMPLIKTTT